MSRAKVGHDVFIGLNTYIELENAHLLAIADRVTIAAYSKLILHDSSLNNVAGFDILYGKIILNNNCYIGANTTILPGSVIGSNTIVGANSLVKGVLKSNSVYVGQPVKYVCSITELKTKWIERIRKTNDSESLYTYVSMPRWNERK